MHFPTPAFKSIVFAWRSLANLCAMAPKGVKKTGLKEQMDPKEVSKMLGCLKYQASPKSKGDSEAKSKAAIALDFVKEAEDIHEYVADCIENANTLLTKWFYKTT